MSASIISVRDSWTAPWRHMVSKIVAILIFHINSNPSMERSTMVRYKDKLVQKYFDVKRMLFVAFGSVLVNSVTAVTSTVGRAYTAVASTYTYYQALILTYLSDFPFIKRSTRRIKRLFGLM